jgi:2-polyprenyl-6-methoxyphenol hydroxylase-like FAD-dependent oxidoreductase
MRKKVEPIGAMVIRAGSYVIKEFTTGELFGATRGTVSWALYDYIREKEPGIRVVFYTKLEGIHFPSRTFTFLDTNSKTTFKVDASKSMVFACDGANSKVRRLLAEHDRTFSF